MNIGILQMKSSTPNECLLDIICLATAWQTLNTLHATFAQCGNAPYAELFCTRAIAQCAYA